MRALSNSKTLVIVRGINSVVQRNFVERMFPEDTVICSLYDYFYNNGHYRFEAHLLDNAFEYSKSTFQKAISNEVLNIALVNPNIEPKKFAFFEKIARQHDYQIFWITVENRDRIVDRQNTPTKLRQKQERKLAESLVL